MATNEYHFITNWRVKGSVQEVSDIIGNADDLVRWWPSVYLDVKTLKSGDERGLGKVVDLYTKGWLPYTLRWYFTVTDIRANGFTLEAHGDFEGSGEWTFTQEGEWVSIVYDWKISAEKPLLRYFSFIMKPLFSANHRWAMERGEASLKLELARRHAATAQERALVPAPPPPTTTSSIPLMAGMVAVFALLVGISFFGVRLIRSTLS